MACHDGIDTKLAMLCLCLRTEHTIHSGTSKAPFFTNQNCIETLTFSPSAKSSSHASSTFAQSSHIANK
eukprot:1670316-Amphidinium_carterae.1